MHIKQNVQLSGCKIEGYVDYGPNSLLNSVNPPPATEVLTFLTVPFEKNARIPTSYFFVDKVTGEVQSSLIIKSLVKHHQNNIDIYMLTGDGHKANIKTFELLGCNLDVYGDFTPYFKHPVTSNQVCCMLDPSHNIKCIRNILATSKAGIMSPKGRISWKYFEHLHNIQNLMLANLGNKISKQHIKYEKCIMRVKFAAEILSSSTAKSMNLLKNLLNENEEKFNVFSGAEATIECCEYVNSSFDILNSQNRFAQGDKEGITIENLKILEAKKNQLISYFKSLRNCHGKFIMNTQAKTEFLGMCMALESVFLVASNILFEMHPPKIMYSYFFRQDLLNILQIMPTAPLVVEVEYDDLLEE